MRVIMQERLWGWMELLLEISARGDSAIFNNYSKQVGFEYYWFLKKDTQSICKFSENLIRDIEESFE